MRPRESPFLIEQDFRRIAEHHFLDARATTNLSFRCFRCAKQNFLQVWMVKPKTRLVLKRRRYQVTTR